MKWVVIMAGGSGQRFWPASRLKKPKQLLNIVGSSTLIRQTYKRARLICPPERICVITGEAIKKEIQQELKNIPEKNIIYEPMIRDTAACIGLAAVIILSRDKNASMAVFPADHVIKNNVSFKKVINSSFQMAEDGLFVTLGIKPGFASTGYGYIEKGSFLKACGKRQFFKVKKFHEKPQESRARRFVRSKSFFWNSGIFVWRADLFMDTLRKHLNKTYQGLMEIKKSVPSQKKFQQSLKKIYSKLPKISVDYAVMEKATNVIVAPVDDLEWDDIGSWTSLQRHYSSDANANVVQGRFLLEDSRNCIFINRTKGNKGLTAAIGLEDLIVIQTDDAVLICKKSKDQDIKTIVQKIERDDQLKRLFR